MARPRATSPLLRSLSVAGAAALLVGLGSAGAQAAPATATAPGTSAEAASQLKTLSAKLQQVSNQYVAAQKLLVTRTAQAKTAAARAESTSRAAAGYQDRIKQLVGSESRTAPFGSFGALMTSDSPDQFAAQASLIDVVSSRRAAVLKAASSAGAAAARANADATAAVAAATRLTKDLATKKAELTKESAQSKVLFDRLSLTEQRELLAGSDDRASRGDPRTDPAPPVGSVPASKRAAVAVATARAQIGKPYVTGGNGPGSFDCSGLTKYAWAAAGVTIPRVSRDQYAAGTKVARADLQPGDLVYFGSPVYHVAIYIGGGQMITAPQPGEYVKYQAVSVFPDYTGATRPGA
ncbi:MAG TPA: C40 family peptidase [Mycobacteriales bacterium]|nr:C40 family peptidase [Mycobacteriales bacterium]